jgi:hypothetical protein
LESAVANGTIDQVDPRFLEARDLASEDWSGGWALDLQLVRARALLAARRPRDAADLLLSAAHPSLVHRMRGDFLVALVDALEADGKTDDAEAIMLAQCTNGFQNRPAERIPVFERLIKLAGSRRIDQMGFASSISGIARAVNIVSLAREAEVEGLPYEDLLGIAERVMREIESKRRL